MKISKPDTETRERNALTWLRLRLDTELDLLTEDDIDTMPRHHLRAILDRHGIAEAAQQPVQPDETPRQWAERDRKAWIVHRPDLCTRVLERIAGDTVTVIGGPAGRGRSTFLRQELRHHPDVLSQYWPIVHIDCCALRTGNVARFEEEALRALYAEREEECQAYLDGLGAQAERPLEAWLSDRLYRDAGLIVLDHAECLALRQSGEMVARMRALVDFCRKKGIKLIVLWGGVFHRKAAKAFGNPSVMEMPLLAPDEVGDWWNRPLFAPCRQAGLDAAEVQRVTGGVPRLVRDFGRFVEDRMAGGGALSPRMAEEFASVMAREYAPEIERALAVARRRPVLLEHPDRAVRHGLGEAMLATGAFRALSPGGAVFASPILERRFRNCTTSGGLHALLQRGTLGETIARRHHQECCASTIADLMLRLAPNEVFGALDTVIHALCEGQERGLGRLVASVAMRDSMNGKLWSDGGALSGETPVSWPLHASADPDFAKAVRTARPVERADGRMLLPIVAGRGRVAAIVTLDMASVPDHPLLPRFRRRLLLRALWRMSLALRPALVQALETHAARRERRAYHRAIYRSASVHDTGELLRHFGCQGVARLRRRRPGWVLEGHDAMPKGPDDAERFTLQGDLLEANDTVRLDGIRDHDGIRKRGGARRHETGLVLEPRALRTIFPEIEWRDDVRVFTIPNVARDRLHLYFFAGREAVRLDGHRQAELTRFTLARDLIAAGG